MAKRALADVMKGLSYCVTVTDVSTCHSIAFQVGRQGQEECAVDLGGMEEIHMQGHRSIPSIMFLPLAKMDLAKGEGGLVLATADT